MEIYTSFGVIVNMKKPNTYLPPTKYLMLILLFLFAFGERVLFDLGPNIELVTTVMILSSFYFAKRQAFWLTFAVLAFSDVIIGNTNIFIFTWSGFLIPAFLASKVFRKVFKNLTTNRQLLTTIFSLTIFGL